MFPFMQATEDLGARNEIVGRVVDHRKRCVAKEDVAVSAEIVVGSESKIWVL